MISNKLYRFLVKQIPVDQKANIKNLAVFKSAGSFNIFKNIILNKENRLDFPKLVREAISAPITYSPEYLAFVNEGEIGEKPLTVNVETTSRCNLRCKMCVRNRLTNEIADMTEEVFRKCVDEIVKINSALKLNRLGEPLLDTHIVERVRYAKDKGVPHVYLNTNGVLLNEDMAAKLIKAGTNRIIISFDGAKKETFEAIRRGANYDRVVANLKGLLRQKKKLGADDLIVVLRITVLDENKDEVLDIYRQWLGLVTNIVPMIVFSYKGIVDSQVVDVGLDERVVCSALFGRSVICNDGTAIICCAGDPDAELKCGNIMSDSLIDCYVGKDAAEIRNIHLRKDFAKLPVCDQCSFTYKNFWYCDALGRLVNREARKIVLAERLMGKSKKVNIF